MSDRKQSMTKKKMMLLGAGSAVLLILADQFTKYLAFSLLKYRDDISLIPNAFSLTYLENHGAAFGIMQGKKILLVLVSMLVLAVISYLFYRLPVTKKFRLLHGVLIFMAAGAIGNMIDRIVHGYVVDFFNFYLINFPVFNVADIYVTVASVVLIFSVFFYYKEEDFER